MREIEKNDLVSIIIPVCDTEEYLIQCLDSVMKQSYSNIEIICIDDASKDSSLSILHKYASSDRRFIVIENSLRLGASTVRNLGIDVAKGHYIVFVDSDDFVDSYYVENLYKGMIDYKVDLIIAKTYRYSSKKGEFSSKVNDNALFMSVANKTIQLKEDLLNHLSKFVFLSVGKIFNAKIIKKYHVRYQKTLVLMEDMVFHFDYMVACGNFSFYFIDSKNYYYRENLTSLSYNIANRISVFDAFSYIEILFVQYGYDQQYKNQLLGFKYMSLLLWSCVGRSVSQLAYYKRLRQELQEISLKDIHSLDIAKKYKKKLIKIRARPAILSYVLIYLLYQTGFISFLKLIEKSIKNWYNKK